MKMDIITTIWLPLAKVPIMEDAFRRLKLKLEEPDLEWCFIGNSYWDETPAVYLRGASEKRKDEIRQKIVAHRMNSRWTAGTGISELGKILTETYHLDEFQGGI